MRTKFLLFPVLGLFLLGGCAYQHFLGLHGPSIRNLPDVHQGASEDGACLSCHHPENELAAPSTSHPHFNGCLKCHNDPI